MTSPGNSLFVPAGITHLRSGARPPLASITVELSGDAPAQPPTGSRNPRNKAIHQEDDKARLPQPAGHPSGRWSCTPAFRFPCCVRAGRR